MIRLLDIPGIREIENRVRLNAKTIGKATDWDLERMVDAVVYNTLKIESRPSSLIWDAIERSGQDIEVVEPEYGSMDEDDEIAASRVQAWRKIGWDLTGDDGRELQCFSCFEDALVCIEARLSGLAKIEIEQIIWTTKKAAEVRATPKERARNQSFLSLGQARRRAS